MTPRAVVGATQAGLVLVSLGAAACSRGASGPADGLAPTVDPVEAAVCSARSGCRLERKLEEAPTVDGRRDVVALAALGPAGPHPGPSLVAHWPDMPQERGDGACFPWELWLARPQGGSTERLQLLISDCTSDVHGQAPLVTDLGGRRVRYTPEPSEDRESFDFALDPPSFERERLVYRGRELTWDWHAFRGQACMGSACVPVLPDVRMNEAGFARGGWKTTTLGDCALRVDRANGSTSPAALRLLLSEQILYVEVTDDVFVTTGAVVDTLEFVWLVPEGKPGDSPRHERLRMDGTFQDSLGKRTTVEMSVTPTSRRFVLPAPSWIRYDQWEATYEDTDDGRAVVERLTTGAPETPPPVFTAPGACVAEGGALRPVSRRSKDLASALAP
jgi:hypothetical protein